MDRMRAELAPGMGIVLDLFRLCSRTRGLGGFQQCVLGSKQLAASRQQGSHA